MRNRLTLAFFGVICLTLALIYLFIQNSPAIVLRKTFRTTFQREIRPLMPRLLVYYEENGNSWKDVDNLLTISADDLYPGNEDVFILPSDLILIDATGKVVAPKVAKQYESQVDAVYLESALPIKNHGETIGYLSSALMLRELPGMLTDEFHRIFSRSILVALLASGIIAMFYALLATDTVVLPITEMTETVEEMARGNLHLRVDPSKYGYQNLVTLADSINYLANSVEDSRKQRQQMISDTAHELRTPLAVQKSYLEAMEDGIIQFDKKSIKTLQEQNILLTRLVNDLRLLSAAEAGELKLVMRRIDLTRLLLVVLDQFSAKLEEANLTIDLKADEPHPIVLGDPNRLEQIIINLLQNERRYAPPGSSLDIVCGKRDGQAVLSFRDYGVGVKEEDRETIFERLYRTEKHKEQVKDGAGLGLAIARRLAEAHGGTLVARAPEGAGVVFILSLPLAAKTPAADHQAKAPRRTRKDRFS